MYLIDLREEQLLRVTVQLRQDRRGEAHGATAGRALRIDPGPEEQLQGSCVATLCCCEGGGVAMHPWPVQIPLDPEEKLQVNGNVKIAGVVAAGTTAVSGYDMIMGDADGNGNTVALIQTTGGIALLDLKGTGSSTYYSEIRLWSDEATTDRRNEAVLDLRYHH